MVSAMFLKSLKFRLTALYSTLVILSSLTLFGIAYTLLYSSLRAEGESARQSALLGFWALYQNGGLEKVRQEMAMERSLQPRPTLIRVAGKLNNTLLLYVPEKWQGFNPGLLKASPAPQGDGRLRLPLKDKGGGWVEVASLQLPDGNLLQVGTDTLEMERILQRFRSVFLLASLPLVALSFLSGFLFSSRSLSPIDHLIGAIRAIIDTGKLNARLPSKGSGNELDQLIQLFNRMLAKIEALVRGMRDTLDNVAHDLRTPLARLKARGETALQSAQDAGACRLALSESLEEAGDILTMLKTLMDISEAETGLVRLEREPGDLSAVVRDIAELYQYAAEGKRIRIETRAPEVLVVPMDLNRIRQVLANLLDNAVKYTPAGGSVLVRASAVDGWATVRVEDTGGGIAAGDLPHIWERLYRSDRSRSQPGLGLGLSLVKAIVEAHGGRVAVESRQGEGSCFSFILPL